MSSMAAFHVTVKGVVCYQGKILILRKVKPSKDGFGEWEFPGGGMEYFESPVEAMHREALEETGLDVEIEYSPLSTFHIGRKDKQIVGIVFLCKAKTDKVVLSDEHVDYKFVTQQEAKQYLDHIIYRDAFQNKQLNFDF